VTRDLLEYEVRRLPGVVAAAVDGDAVVVLADATVDADALSVVVRAMLASAGVELPVRIFGGMSSPATRPRRSAPVMVGAVGGVGVLASFAVAAAMTGGLPIFGDAEPPAADAAHIGAAAKVHDVPRARSGSVVVPGPSPEWAAGQGSWPLPAALPAVTPFVPAPVVAQAPESQPILIPLVPVEPPVALVDEPVIEKDPKAVPGLGVTTPATVPPKPPVSENVGDGAGADAHAEPDDEGHGHAHDDQGLHLGWTLGPAHANPRSSADSAPRGGHK
jgi:hypothetical protein